MATGTALLLAVPTVPALADPTSAPAPATEFTGSVGDRVADLSWTNGSGDGAIVRDVTAVTGFLNRTTQRYAVWTTSGNTPSATPDVEDIPVVPLVPTLLTLAVSRSAAAYGTPITVTGRLARTGGGAVAHQEIDLYGRNGGTSAPVLLQALHTGSDGTVSTVLRPEYTVALGLRFTGDAFSGPSSSPLVSTQVAPLVAAALSVGAVARTQPSTVRGFVSPGHSGTRVVVQQLTTSGWRSTVNLVTDARGRFGYVLATPSTGSFRYRVVLPGSAGWSTSASQPLTLRVTDRDLTTGVTGADVLALQHQLASLQYNVGRFDGSFGRDLRHAVITFQKVERLAPTGVWSTQERTRAVHPTSWKLRYPHGAGFAVEVDVTRQVLVASKNGIVVKIVDVSTGGGYRYTSEGVTSVAATPRGQYRVQRKINGVHFSPLGYLYRPSFFTGGYAIHGEGYDVPSTPVSHGCVRVTNSNADYLFPLLSLGTPVVVYDE